MAEETKNEDIRSERRRKGGREGSHFNNLKITRKKKHATQSFTHTSKTRKKRTTLFLKAN